MVDKKLDDNKEEITDAEIVSDTAVTPVDDLKNIENLINANIQKIDKFHEDITPVAEMIESLLDADLQYAELDQKAKEAAKERSIKKKELTNTSNGKELNEKLRSLRSELKEAREALSTYLQEYQKKTGFNEYESPDGELRQIVFTVKLVKKTKLNWD
jgi:predicted Zn-dependent protease